MNETYYSVEQISEMLHIHPKTIQRYIREGKLRATKLGKSWRVTGHDLSVFMELTKTTVDVDKNKNVKEEHPDIKVSSVIDIEVKGIDEANRIINTVHAALNSPHTEYDFPAVHVLFIQAERKVRITLWGNLKLAQDVLHLIEGITEGMKGDDFYESSKQ